MGAPLRRGGPVVLGQAVREGGDKRGMSGREAGWYRNAGVGKSKRILAIGTRGRSWPVEEGY